MAYQAEVFGKLLPYVPVTLLLTAASFAQGLVLALFVTAMKLSKLRILRALATAYITAIRCTPSVIIFFLAFFGLPILLSSLGIRVGKTSSVACSIFALTLMGGGIMAEMLRAAYLSVDKFQFEGAVSVGLTPFQALRTVVLPQAVFIALPNLGNMVVALLQESSLAYLIGTIDVIGRATIVSATGYGINAVSIYLVVTLIYWGIAVALGRIIELLLVWLGRSRPLVTSAA
jgi:L-cystine transport system permease protein